MVDFHIDTRRFEFTGTDTGKSRLIEVAYPATIRSAVGSQIMSRFWSSLVHSLSPYLPGEQPKLEGIVKLNTNEIA